jgi:hypothetical protein
MTVRQNYDRSTAAKEAETRLQSAGDTKERSPHAMKAGMR